MRRILIWVGVLAALFLALAGARALARSRTFQLFGELVTRVETADPVVALTFDDGPTTARLDDILRVLDERNVRATFFVNGADLDAFPEGGKHLVEAGHELGNHTYSHARMVMRSPGFVREEIERTDAAIRAAGHAGEIHFRPPYSYKLVVLPWVLRQAARKTIMMDIEPDSYREVAAEARRIAEHVRERVRPGSIILLHIWYRSRDTSFDAVPLIIDDLQARGYEFVTVSELLQRRSGKTESAERNPGGR